MAFRCVAAWMACACLLAGCQSWRGGTYTLPEEMVLIPAGWFLMGQNEGAPSNQPQRLVYVDAFAIDQTEVTQAAFAPYAKLALQHPLLLRPAIQPHRTGSRSRPRAARRFMGSA